MQISTVKNKRRRLQSILHHLTGNLVRLVKINRHAALKTKLGLTSKNKANFEISIHNLEVVFEHPTCFIKQRTGLKGYLMWPSPLSNCIHKF